MAGCVAADVAHDGESLIVFEEKFGKNHNLKICEIFRMCIDEKYGRIGIGTKLLKSVEEFCEKKAYDIIILSTCSVNSAQHFYEKNKYVLAGTCYD